MSRSLGYRSYMGQYVLTKFESFFMSYTMANLACTCICNVTYLWTKCRFELL